MFTLELDEHRFTFTAVQAKALLDESVLRAKGGTEYQHRAWLWTFLEHPVEPTNNASERALRHAVIWRKLSFGAQSQGGSRFVETMLTVIETCRQQSRDVFAYITDVVQAHFAYQPTPSLLPEA
jgi:hypothetical protein